MKKGIEVKFFSLIDKSKSIHVAPGSKVIPAEAFSSVFEAKEIVELAQKEAEEYRKQVEKECEELKEEAKKSGFDQGLNEWASKLAEFEKDVADIRQETEKIIVPLALKAAKKIVAREIELNQETVVDIVSNALRAVAHHKNVKIHVNRGDLVILEQNKQRLKDVLESIEVLSLQESDEVEPSGCVIETEGGIINAQIDNQWNALERAFQSLMTQ